MVGIRIGRELQVFVQISNPIQEDRRLANFVRRDTRDSKQGGQTFTVDKGKHIKSRFAVVDRAGNRIYMREDEIYCFLGEVIERFSLWNNISEQGMVLLYLRFLAGLHRIAKEQMQFLLSIRIVFKGKDIRELSAVIREDNREQSGRRIAFGTKLVL